MHPVVGVIGVGEVGRGAYPAGNRDDMPKNARALTRAARERSRATGETYTQAREALLIIRERMRETGESFQEASAHYDDPATTLLCATCGWTVGMVCPECSPGCGCVSTCSGWRHREYSHDDDLMDDDDGDCECECGASHEYECVCG